MSVLECACVNIFVDPVKDLVPLLLVLRYRYCLLLCEVAACGIYGFPSVNPGGDECGQSSGDLLALTSHCPETIDGSLCGT